FPERDDGQAIALYLGLKLVPNGSIAVFCGRKSTAASVCEKAVDIIERGVPLALPSDFSDAQEVERLRQLHVENLGADAPASQSSAHGIFSHHGNTPDRKSTRLNSSHVKISYAVFCLKKKKNSNSR